MKTKNNDSERRYLLHIIAAHENAAKGNLTSLMSVYEDYGEPSRLSPHNVFGHPSQRQYIKEFISKYPEDRIIEYHDHDIMVNAELLKIYLGVMDIENFNKSVMVDRLWDFEEVGMEMVHLLIIESRIDSQMCDNLPF